METTGNTDDWDALCERLGSADSQAMRRVFVEYSEQLRRLASKNIHPALLRRFDGEDVVQSAFRTFFRRLQSGELTIKGTEHLWKLLATITLCKTRSHARRHTAECRDVGLEQAVVAEQQLGSGPASADDVLALWEEIDHVLKGLPAHTSAIVSERLAGKGKTEIARELGLTRQTVHRLIRLVEDRLTQRLDKISPPSEMTSTDS